MVHWSKNPKMRIKTIKKISETKKGRKNPEHSKKMKEYWKTHKHPMLGEHRSKKTKEKISKTVKKLWANPNSYFNSKEYRNKLSKRTNMLGKHHSKKSRRKMSLSHKGKKLSKEHKREIGKSVSKTLSKPGMKEKWSLKTEKTWKNPVIREKRTKAIIKTMGTSEYQKKQQKARHLHPNIPEQLLINIINQYLLPFTYTGNYSFFVGIKNPDFHGNDGHSHQVINLFGVYWHLSKVRNDENNPDLTREDIEKRCIEYYKKHGYSCLIIWEDELKNEVGIVNKIKDFISD